MIVVIAPILTIVMNHRPSLQHQNIPMFKAVARSSLPPSIAWSSKVPIAGHTGDCYRFMGF